MAASAISLFWPKPNCGFYKMWRRILLAVLFSAQKQGLPFSLGRKHSSRSSKDRHGGEKNLNIASVDTSSNVYNNDNSQKNEMDKRGCTYAHPIMYRLISS